MTVKICNLNQHRSELVTINVWLVVRYVGYSPRLLVDNKLDLAGVQVLDDLLHNLIVGVSPSLFLEYNFKNAFAHVYNHSAAPAPHLLFAPAS